MKYRAVLKMISITSLIAILSGCAAIKNMNHSIQKNNNVQNKEYVIGKKEVLVRKCDNANMLLADLALPAKKRVYAIKPGVKCNGV